MTTTSSFMRLPCPDSGAQCWLEIEQQPLFDAHQQLWGILAHARDVSAARQASASAWDTETRFQQLFTQVEGVSVQGYDRERTVIYWNPASERLYGYDAEQAIGRQLEDLIIPETMRELVIKAVDSWLAGAPAAPPGEMTLRRADGSPVHVFSSHVMLRGPNGEAQMYCTDIDLTERKTIAEELERYRHQLEELVIARTAESVEARERAEAANHAKSSFLANMSHEIRSPMNAILGLTHLLKREAVTRTQRDRLTRIQNAGNHLLAIINDILDLSKIEAGKFSLDTNDFSVAELFEQISALVQEEVSARALTLGCDATELPARLHGDSTRVRQAVLNYLSNAIKFTHAGSIWLRARLIEEHEQDVLVRFEVEDTGVGIAAQDLATLFKPFSQVDDSSTRPHGGTGLGLAITRRLARLMGGDAGASSEPGKGSLFWFTARLTRARDQTPQVSEGEVLDAEQRLSTQYRGARILLVDDNLINQEVESDLLRTVGLKVDTADHGREALEKALARHYDLILMDVQMPELDGLSATRMLHARSDWAACPIIAMTANAFEENQRRCREAGMDDHLTKPIDPTRLYAVLLHWLSHGVSTVPARSEPTAPDTVRLSATEQHALAPLLDSPEVDVNVAVRNLHGKVDVYLRLVQKYAEQYGSDGERMRAALHAQDHEHLLKRAHGLRGVASMLGFIRVRDLCVEIESLTQGGHSSAALIDALTRLDAAQAQVLAAIAALSAHT